MDESVLIAVQQHAGHRLTYARLLAQGVLDGGDRAVLALTDEGIRSREFDLHLRSVAQQCRVVRLRRAPLSTSGIHRLAREHHCTRVLVPDGDRFAIRLGLTWRRHGGVTFVVLVLTDPQWNSGRGFVRRLRLRLKSLLLRRAGRLNGTRLLYLADPSQRPDGASRLIAPDPVLFDAAERDPQDLRRRLGLTRDRFWFLVAGAVSPRKNLPTVLSALLPLATAPVGLFVCGQIDPAVRRDMAPLLAQAESVRLPVLLSDRTQTDHALNCAIQAADCVVVAYSTDSPTSMMSKSVRAGRRVIVAGSPSLRKWAANLGIELTGPLTHESLTALMRAAIARPAPEPRPELDHTAFVRAFL